MSISMISHPSLLSIFSIVKTGNSKSFEKFQLSVVLLCDSKSSDLKYPASVQIIIPDKFQQCDYLLDVEEKGFLITVLLPKTSIPLKIVFLVSQTTIDRRIGMFICNNATKSSLTFCSAASDIYNKNNSFLTQHGLWNSGDLQRI